MPKLLLWKQGSSTYFIHSSFRQTRHWSTTSTERFWLVRAASILFKIVGPTAGAEKGGKGDKEDTWTKGYCLHPYYYFLNISPSGLLGFHFHGRGAKDHPIRKTSDPRSNMEFSEGPWDIKTGSRAFVFFSPTSLLLLCFCCALIKRSLKTKGYEKAFMLCTI